MDGVQVAEPVASATVEGTSFRKRRKRAGNGTRTAVLRDRIEDPGSYEV
jgi:hypothetical protein